MRLNQVNLLLRQAVARSLLQTSVTPTSQVMRETAPAQHS